MGIDVTRLLADSTSTFVPMTGDNGGRVTTWSVAKVLARQPEKIASAALRIKVTTETTARNQRTSPGFSRTSAMMLTAMHMTMTPVLSRVKMLLLALPAMRLPSALK
jgi:hypothetical protein